MKRLIRRVRRLDRRRLDQAVAALFVVIGELELAVQWEHGGTPVMALLLAVAYTMLAFRRTQPVLTAATILGLWILANVALTDVEPLQLPLFAVLFACWSMGAHASGRAAIAAPLVILVGMTGVVSTWEDPVFSDFVFPSSFALIAWLAGRGVRTRTRLTEELHEAAVQAQEAHEEDIALAAAEERRRIAREMHDVVAHSVSVMVVQAGGARRILERDPARAVEAAARIEEVGRAAHDRDAAAARRAAPQRRARPATVACATSTRWSSARARPACRCR